MFPTEKGEKITLRTMLLHHFGGTFVSQCCTQHTTMICGEGPKSARNQPETRRQEACLNESYAGQPLHTENKGNNMCLSLHYWADKLAPLTLVTVTGKS